MKQEFTFNELDIKTYLVPHYHRRFTVAASVYMRSKKTKEVAEALGIGYQRAREIIPQCKNIIHWHKNLERLQMLNKAKLINMRTDEIFEGWHIIGKIFGHFSVQQVLEIGYQSLLMRNQFGPVLVIRMNTILSFLNLPTIEPAVTDSVACKRNFMIGYYTFVYKIDVATAKKIAWKNFDLGWGDTLTGVIKGGRMYPQPRCFESDDVGK